MATRQDCRLSAEICLRLARNTKDIYRKKGLIELAAEFRAMAEEIKREARAELTSRAAFISHMPRIRTEPKA
jgi:hypothetical protein